MNKKSGRSSIVLRLLKLIKEFYPVMMPVTIVCIVFSAIVSSVPAVFMQNVIAVIEQSWQTGDWDQVGGQILRLVSILAVFYILSLASSLAFNQLMAVMTQGTLKKLRVKMFNGMQRLPVKYFDTNNHGDIMSYYTNDIDTLRQMVSQSFPQILTSSIMVLTVFCIMLYYSIWLAIVIVFGMIIMLLAVRKIGGGSARNFFRQQVAVGKVEGFVEEIMNGEKVVKVFCHERETEADFDRLNEELYTVAKQANRYANILGPVLNNMGNALYVLVAVTGGLLLLAKAPNLSISGLGFSISIVVPFLNMTKQFSGNIFQVSNQINSVVMGLAGAERIFTLRDQQPEADDGYVTLVNVREEADGTLSLPAEDVARLPQPLAVRAVRALLARASGGDDRCSAAHLEALTDLCRTQDPSARIDLPGGLTARREYGRLILTRLASPPPLSAVELALPGLTRAGDWEITCTLERYRGQAQQPLDFFLDRSAAPALTVRSRQTGDRLTLPGRPGRSLKKWYVDEKIPRTLRDQLPVLESGGRVAGAAGLGPDAAFLPSEMGEAWHIRLVHPKFGEKN